MEKQCRPLSQMSRGQRMLMLSLNRRVQDAARNSGSNNVSAEVHRPQLDKSAPQSAGKRQLRFSRQKDRSLPSPGLSLLKVTLIFPTEDTTALAAPECWKMFVHCEVNKRYTGVV